MHMCFACLQLGSSILLTTTPEDVLCCFSLLACNTFGRIGTTIRPCLLNGSYQCVPDRDMDCITDSQVMVSKFAFHRYSSHAALKCKTLGGIHMQSTAGSSYGIHMQSTAAMHIH